MGWKIWFLYMHVCESRGLLIILGTIIILVRNKKCCQLNSHTSIVRHPDYRNTKMWKYAFLRTDTMVVIFLKKAVKLKSSWFVMLCFRCTAQWFSDPICECVLFQILFPSKLLQNVKYSSLYRTSLLVIYFVYSSVYFKEIHLKRKKHGTY